ncbi:NUDIX domain-containing protein [Calidifontibacter terrae]
MLNFTDYDTRLAAYAAIIDDSDRILLSYWNGEGRFTPAWTMPGGGVEFEETIAEGLVREVYEETGFHIELGPLLLVDSWFRESESGTRPFKAVRVVHRATIVGGTLGTTEVDGSTDEARWIPLADVAGLERTGLVDAVTAALRDAPTS